MNKNGILTISLDFELFWGMRDKKIIPEYQENLAGVSFAIDEILNKFKEYNIHATWASVGFLFYENADDLKKNIPKSLPNYDHKHLNPYDYISDNQLEKKYHFAPEIIKKIINTPNQEIGTHTMSHYYCLEKGQTKHEFFDDLTKAIETIKEKTNSNTYSLVFPRNQWNKEYLTVLSDLNILCYRGNESSWIYNAVNEEDESKTRRAVRLLDSYLNISGHNTYTLKELAVDTPFNIPSSRFLRPVSKKLSFAEPLRLRRIKKAMTYAAKNKELFHLWWHPHNFGADPESNIAFLDEILKHYKFLENKYGMTSLSMHEISTLLKEEQNETY